MMGDPMDHMGPGKLTRLDWAMVVLTILVTAGAVVVVVVDLVKEVLR
jgi:hypothetical protein